MTQHNPAPAGRIGPNAIIRLAESVRHAKGDAAVRRLFDHADCRSHLDSPPQDMVPEQTVVRLHASLRAAFDRADCRDMLWNAGRRTGDYLLAHRIPGFAQRLLKLLPAGPSARILVKAIRANAWTFVGTGRFDAEMGPPLSLIIADSPLCRGMVAQEPQCDFYTGTFQRLFAALVSPKAAVTETACLGAGAEVCRFTVTW